MGFAAVVVEVSICVGAVATGDVCGCVPMGAEELFVQKYHPAPSARSISTITHIMLLVLIYKMYV